MNNRVVPSARFGAWLVVSRGVPGRALCRCDCGTERQVSASALAARRTTSCGCRKAALCAAVHIVHGRADTPEHVAWMLMRGRCGNPNHPKFARYGGRGIKVCARWRDFESFFADVGPRPSPAHSIDRVDNDGDYEPGNVRWATVTEQANNRRTNRRIAFDGVCLTIAQWAARRGWRVQIIRDRLRRRWSARRTLMQPPRSPYGVAGGGAK